MTKSAIETLHEIHSATNDVLEGYLAMKARAKPEIQSVIHRLDDLHQRHAAEQKAELMRLRDAGTAQDDSSLQGTMNKVVVTLRDWVANLDQAALPKVRAGEESLRNQYEKALENLAPEEDTSVRTMLHAQMASIEREIVSLPSS